jgi:hypothetical protein
MRKAGARHGSDILRGALTAFAGVLVALASSGAAAASVTNPFRVSVLLLPPFKDCTAVTQPSSVSVSCPGSGVTSLPDPRYLLHIYRGNEVVQTVDATTEPGTVTSWRVVRGSNRDFLEIVVGW